MKVWLERHWPILFIFGLVLFLYFPVFSLYFSQDDFFHLRTSTLDGSLRQFISFFGFPNQYERGYAFYRPLFREAYYFLITRFFGISPTPFRIASFGLHFTCIFMVFVLMERLFKRQLFSFLTALFYGVATSQVGTFYYHAGGIQVSGALLFLLLSNYFYWQFLENKLKKYWVLTLICFVASLSSHELIIAILPLSLIGLEFLLTKRISWKWARGVVFRLGPLFVVFAIYLFLDLVKIGLPGQVSYSPIVSLRKMANSLVWYTGWGLGLPDMLVDFVGPGIKLNPNLMRWWGSYFKLIFPTFFLVVISIFGATVYLFLNQRKIFKNKNFWFLVLWYPIAIAPVIILPWHKFLHYLNPALPALFGIVFFVILAFYDLLIKKNKILAKIFLIGFCFVLFLLSFVSIKLEEKTYWPINRGKIAKNLVEQIKQTYPILPKGATLYFENDPEYPKIAPEWGNSSTQAYYALSGKDAVQLLYNDPTIKVYYEDLEKPPEEIDEIFPITAIISQK